MLNGEEINNAYKYENFINRIFGKDKRLSKASKKEFTDLLLVEKGSFSSILPSYEIQSKAIKHKIERAFEMLYKHDLTENEKKWLPILMSENAQAKKSVDFVKVIERGLEFTDRFKQ